MNYNLEEDMEANNIFGDTFVLLGRNPKCGCPLAIDMNPTKSSQDDLIARGLLLEFMAEGAAQVAWENASWPCSHSNSKLQ